MAWEDESFFIVAEKALLPEDWAEIDARLKCFIEPLRKQGGQTGYKHINRYCCGRAPALTSALPQRPMCLRERTTQPGSGELSADHGAPPSNREGAIGNRLRHCPTTPHCLARTAPES